MTQDNFQDWTAKQVREWVVEAAQTLMLLPRSGGPSGDGNSMPEMLREEWKDAAKTSTLVYRRRPSADALDRMEKVWGWINALPNEEERRLIYTWSRAKVSKRQSLGRFAEENGIHSRTLSRAVMAVCQRIANALNRDHSIRLTVTFDDVSEISHEVDSKSISSKNCARKHGPLFFRDPDAKLRSSTPEEAKALTRVLERQKRQREARRRAAA